MIKLIDFLRPDSSDEGFKGNEDFRNVSGNGENRDVFTNEDNSNLENNDRKREVFTNQDNSKFGNNGENEKGLKMKIMMKVGNNKIIIENKKNYNLEELKKNSQVILNEEIFETLKYCKECNNQKIPEYELIRKKLKNLGIKFNFSIPKK